MRRSSSTASTPRTDFRPEPKKEPNALASMSTVLAALLLATLQPSTPQADQPYAPSAVMNALEAQAQERPIGPLPSCTLNGFNGATDRAIDDAKNKRWLDEKQSERDYSIGFARCALTAADRHQFLLFAGTTSTMLIWSIYGDRQLTGDVDDYQRNSGLRAKTIAGWVTSQPVNAAEKHEQDTMLKLLDSLGLWNNA